MENIKPKILVFVLLIFGSLCSSIFGQEAPNLKLIDKGLVFDNVFTRNGLPDNRIRSIFQNKKGFIWIGTMNGLTSYDGYNYTKYFKGQDGVGIAGNWVFAIAEDDQENMWIGTTEGLSKIETSKGNISNYISSEYLTNKEIRSLFIDNLQRVWIGTKKGLSIFNPSTGDIVKFTDGIFSNSINSIERDQQGYIWVTCETGIVRFNEKDLAYYYLPLSVKDNPYGDRMWDILPLEKEIWIATAGDGVYIIKFDELQLNSLDIKRKHNITEKFLGNTEVFDFAKDERGDIWIASAKGLHRFAADATVAGIETFRHQNVNSFSLSYNKLFKLHFDDSKNLLIGSEMGLNILLHKNLNFQNFNFEQNSYKDAVRGITSTDHERLFFITTSKGVYEISGKGVNTEKLTLQNSSDKTNFGRSIAQIGQTLFIGTLDGVLIKDLKKGKESHILPNKNIFSIVGDSTNLKVYIGASDGLYIYDYKKAQLLSKQPLIEGFARHLHMSTKGNLIAGFDGPDLYIKRKDTDKFKKIDLPSNFHGFEINGIDTDKEENIWIGTPSGLNKISIDKQGNYNCHFFDEKDGLVDKAVNGLIVDKKNNVWLSTIKGITKFNPKNNYFEYFLPNLIFNPSSYYKQNDSTLIFGHLEGFVKFNPNEISTQNNTPHIQITSLRVNNERVEIGKNINGNVILSNKIGNTDKIVLNYKNNGFTFEFANLNKTFEVNREYAYKLEGFDADWVNSKIYEHTATYTNLDPGIYHFKVKAKGQNLIDGHPEITVKVLPPPWKSWWAILLYILMLNGLILLFVKFKIENARRANQLSLERQEKEQIKELNNQKLQFFTNISHEFRTPVTLISGPIKDILNDPSISIPLKRKARIIEKNSDKMIYLIDELITFRELGLGLLELKPKPLDIAQFIAETIEYFQLFAEKKEVIISCQSFLANNIIMADPMQLYKVLNNLIANALKFCPFNSVVKVEIDRVKKRNLTVESRKTDSDWISISVRDQGAGIPKEHILNLFERFYKGEDRQSGTGIGLSLAKEIVELHKGYLEVESEPGNTNFIVYLPKGQPEKAQNQLLAGVAPYHEKLKPESLLIHETLELDESYGIDLGNFDKKDILLVEDNNELLQYLLMLLKDEFNVATASNGIEGLLQLDKKTPHAIVTDVVMPKMDGFKFCEKIKNDPKTSHIPLILLTAKTMTNDKIKGLELGADDYLDKPFNPEILKARIHMLIKNRENLIEIINSDATIDFSKLAKNPIDEKFMRKAIGYIHENLDNEEFSVEQFSDQMAMSRSNLFRRIKIITKMSPVDFIYHIRLQVSMKLLIERKLSVSEIAWKVGFKNPSSFSKSFKKQFGKSPSGYLNDLLKR